MGKTLFASPCALWAEIRRTESAIAIPVYVYE